MNKGPSPYAEEAAAVYRAMMNFYVEKNAIVLSDYFTAAKSYIHKVKYSSPKSVTDYELQMMDEAMFADAIKNVKIIIDKNFSLIDRLKLHTYIKRDYYNMGLEPVLLSIDDYVFGLIKKHNEDKAAAMAPSVDIGSSSSSSSSSNSSSSTAPAPAPNRNVTSAINSSAATTNATTTTSAEAASAPPPKKEVPIVRTQGCVGNSCVISGGRRRGQQKSRKVQKSRKGKKGSKQSRRRV